LNDLDGNDSAPGAGGEEYAYTVDLSQFNTTSMTTVSIDLDAFTIRNQAFELVNTGDGLLTDFNLYYIGMVLPQGAGLYDLEIESITVTVPPQGLAGDFDGDSDVDGSDFLVWQRQLGGPGSADANNNGVVDGDDLTTWRNNFGNALAAPSAAAVPEPTAFAVIGAALLASISWRRRRTG
jgi:hypothetical protein